MDWSKLQTLERQKKKKIIIFFLKFMAELYGGHDSSRPFASFPPPPPLVHWLHSIR